VFKIQLDTALINSALRRAPEYNLSYRHGCILGQASLPLGAVRFVVVPNFNGTHLVFSIPFSEIKGEITGFLLSKLLGMFWGMIGKQIDAAVLPKLRRLGLPHDTITHEKRKTPQGEVGQIKVSAEAINWWLSSQHPRLTPSLISMEFSPEGVELQGDLRSVT